MLEGRLMHYGNSVSHETFFAETILTNQPE
jgi:hypothetical protein